MLKSMNIVVKPEVSSTTPTLKCFVVDDGTFSQYICAESAGKAKSIAYQGWYYYDPELFLWLRVRRFQIGDDYAKTLLTPQEIDDEKILKSWGIFHMCEECNSNYLIGDECGQCQKDK